MDERKTPGEHSPFQSAGHRPLRTYAVHKRVRDHLTDRQIGANPSRRLQYGQRPVRWDCHQGSCRRCERRVETQPISTTCRVGPQCRQIRCSGFRCYRRNSDSDRNQEGPLHAANLVTLRPGVNSPTGWLKRRFRRSSKTRSVSSSLAREARQDDQHRRHRRASDGNRQARPRVRTRRAARMAPPASSGAPSSPAPTADAADGAAADENRMGVGRATRRRPSTRPRLRPLRLHAPARGSPPRPGRRGRHERAWQPRAALSSLPRR